MRVRLKLCSGAEVGLLKKLLKQAKLAVDEFNGL